MREVEGLNLEGGGGKGFHRERVVEQKAELAAGATKGEAGGEIQVTEDGQGHL